MTATPGQRAYEARQASLFRRHGATPDEPIPAMYAWDQLTDDQRADEKAGAQAALNDAFPGLRKQLDDYAARLKAADQSWTRLAIERDQLRDAYEQTRDGREAPGD